MNDTLNNQVTYPVYINGRRVWFMKSTEDTGHGFWVGGYEQTTFFNRDYYRYAIYFQNYAISNAHSSYLYKFMGGSRKFYAFNNF